jgi:hypothetical protein
MQPDLDTASLYKIVKTREKRSVIVNKIDAFLFNPRYRKLRAIQLVYFGPKIEPKL